MQIDRDTSEISFETLKEGKGGGQLQFCHVVDNILNNNGAKRSSGSLISLDHRVTGDLLH